MARGDAHHKNVRVVERRGQRVLAGYGKRGQVDALQSTARQRLLSHPRRPGDEARDHLRLAGHHHQHAQVSHTISCHGQVKHALGTSCQRQSAHRETRRGQF